MVERICDNKDCRIKFRACAADVRRGWGRFHSKRCKAIEQTQRTGERGPVRMDSIEDIPDCSWDAHEVPRVAWADDFDDDFLAGGDAWGNS